MSLRMSKIGDGIATLSWRAAGQIFETTSRLRGKSLKRRLLDSFTAAAKNDRREAALLATSAAGVATSWVRSGAEAYDAIARSIGGGGIARLPAVHGLYLAEGILGTVGVARLPAQLRVARADVMEALKTGSRTDEAKAVDSIRGAGGIVTGTALSLSSAVWAVA